MTDPTPGHQTGYPFPFVAPVDLCENCGHDWGDHDLHETETNVIGGIEVPVAGWVTCPAPECPCLRTWSLTEEKD